MQNQFSKLLAKIKVGARELPNRIIFGSHPTNFALDNLFTERHFAYYRERARGGAGMIVLEEQLVHPSDRPYEKALFGYDKHIVPGCRRIAEEARRYGAVVVAELNHSGMQSESSTAMRELWAPSAVPDVVSREVPKAMEKSDIEAVVAGFARAAAHAAAGGLDGVEINAAQFSLIRQFMSPLTNYRNDKYGSNMMNRLRFCVEVLQSVRQALGKDRLLGLRLCGDEFAPWGGLTPQDALAMALELEKLSLLDYMTVSVGSLFSLHLSTATYYSKPGLAVNTAAEIKRAVKLPVFVAGRIHRPELAAGIIGEGLADGVCMNRALICDPRLPAKIARGEPERVLGCISCNQGCQVRHAMGKPLSCVLNPLAGVECEEENLPTSPAAVRKKVLVVGGGPAGLEAARVAARRGHRVTLWESGSAPGGRFAASAYIGEYAGVLQVWAGELVRAGVKVSTGKLCGPDDILAEEPDVLILATGARPGRPSFAIKNCPVLPACEVLKNTGVAEKTVLFRDEIGDRVMGRAVEKLLSAGNRLYFVTPDLFVGSKMAVTMELTSWNQRCLSGLDRVFVSSEVVEIDGGRAVIENRFSGQTQTLTGIELLVCNCWPKPDDSLYASLKNRVQEIYRVGDCLAPRGIGAAIREGYHIGRSI